MSFKPIPNLNGTQADFAGSITMSGLTVATQSWVSSQNYLTSETDDQTLDEVLAQGNTSSQNINVGDITGSNLTLDNNSNIYADGVGYLRLGNTSGGKIYVSGDVSQSIISPVSNDLCIQTERDGDDIIFKGGASVTEIMRLDADTQRVGIGTTSPNNQLDVVGSASIDVLQHQSETTNYWALGSSASYQQRVTSRTATAITQVIEGHSSQSADLLQIRSSSASNGNYVTVNSGGNVGIGTTSPSYKLHIKENGYGFKLEGLTDGKYLRMRGDGSDAYIDAQGQNYLVLNSSGNGVKVLSGSSLTKFVIGADSEAIYRQGNTLKLRTNSADRLFIDSSGNVGIGTTSPSAKLDVNSSSGFGILVERGIEDGSRDGYSHSYAAGNAHILGRSVVLESTLWFSNPSPDATTSTYSITTNSSDKLVIKRAVGGVTQDSNIFVVDGSNVGIGTDSPSHPLEVAGNIKGSSFTIGTDTVYSNDLNITNSGKIRIGNAEFFAKSSNDLSIYSGKLNVTSAGNVGIGTTSPAQKLHISGGIARFSNTASNWIEIDGSVSGNNTARISSRFNRFEIQTNTGAGDPHISFMPASGGHVGIGETAPTYPLVVNHSAYNEDNYVEIKSANGNNAGILLKDPGGTRGLVLANSDNDLVFMTSGESEKMRIEAGGNVGIGTTSPSWKLHVNSTTRAAILGNGTPWKSDGVAYIGSYYGTHTPLLVDHHNASTNSSNFAEFRNGDDDIAIKLKADGSADFAGDLAVSGGDITLDGTATSTFTIDTSNSFGRELTLSTNGILPTISANSDLLIKTSNSHTQIKLEGGGSTDNIQFIANEVEQVRITTAGVGIGTTSPTAKLHAYQTISTVPSIVSRVPYKTNADAQLKQRAALRIDINEGSSSLSIGGIGSAHGGFIQSYSTNSTSTHRNFVLNPFGGNVGIGFGVSAAPTEKLHVNGTFKSTGASYFDSTIEVGSSSAGGVILTSPGGGRFLVTINNSGELQSSSL